MEKNNYQSPEADVISMSATDIMNESYEEGDDPDETPSVGL